MLCTETGKQIRAIARFRCKLSCSHYSKEACAEIFDYLLRWQENIKFNKSIILRTFEEITEPIEHWLSRYKYKSITAAEEDGFVIVPLNNGNHLIIDMDVFNEFETI